MEKQKKTLRQHEEETLRGAILKREPIIFWLTTNSGILF